MLLVALVGVPVIYFPTFINTSVPKFALLAIVVPAVLALRVAEIAQGASRPDLSRLAIPAAGAGLATAIAWVASSEHTWSLVGDLDRMQGLIPQALVIAFGVLLADAFGERRRDIAVALIAAGVLVGLYGLLQTFNADPFLETNRSDFVGPPSTLGNPNFSGAFLAMVLPLCAALWIQEPKFRRHLAVAGGVIAACLIATDSQGPWGGAIAGLCIFAAYGLFSRGLGRRLLIVGAVVVAVSFVTIVVVEIRSADPPAIDTTSWARGQLWITAGRMIEERPIFGWGTEGFELAGVRFRTPADALYWDVVISDDPHNIYLATAVSAGLMGMIGTALLLGWTYRRISTMGTGDPLRAAFAGGVVAYLVIGIVSIDQISFRAPFWALLAGLALSPIPAKRRRAERLKEVPKKRAFVPLKPAAVGALTLGTVLTLVSAGWGLSMMVSDFEAREGAKAVSRGDVRAGFNSFESAAAWWNEFEYPVVLARNLGHAVGRDPTVLQGSVSELIAAFRYLDTFQDVPAMNVYGEILYGMGEVDGSLADRAVEIWRDALILDPNDPVLRIHLADAYTGDGDPHAALEVLEPLRGYLDDPRIDFLNGRSVNWPSRFYGASAAAHMELGDEAQAVELAQAALELDPTEPRATAILQQQPSGP